MRHHLTIRTAARFGGLLFLCLTVAAATTACSGKSGSKKKPAKPRPVPTKQVDPATVGTVDGVVSFAGPVPKANSRKVTDATCRNERASGRTIPDIVVQDGKVANAFVHIKEGLEEYIFETSSAEVEIDQVGCSYLPLVVGAQVGQPVVFINSDKTMHNVHTLPDDNDSTNFAMPRVGMRKPITFDAPEVIVKTKCDVHPWMRAYIGVVRHPHFAVTGEDGAFSLTGVPPGDYVVEVWHERFGRQTQKVTLPPSGEQSVNFQLEAK